MEGAAIPDLTLELRSRTLPTASAATMLEPTDNPPAASAAPIICGAVQRQRDPPVFSGAGETDVEDWLSTYERVSENNKWDDPTKLRSVIFYLADVANLWFRNHERELQTWSAFKAAFTEVFGRPALRKLRAEQRLRQRAQQPGETYTSYIEDVVDICARVDSTMSEEDKVKHILKGIEDDAFQMLLARNPSSVAAVVTLCQSFDELRRQRVLARSAVAPGHSLSGLTLPSNSSPESSLSVQIKDFIREEVARQLSMLPLSDRPLQPDTSLAAPIRRAIREELADSLPLAQPCPPVAAPLTYAAVAARPAPPTFAFPATVRPQAVPTPVSPPIPPRSQVQNPWRTRDNRPICFACGFAGHVARFCHRRMPPTNPAVSTPGYGYSHDATGHSMHPDPEYPPSSRRPFGNHRSPSPRRRSLSPLRRRQSPSEGN